MTTRIKLRRDDTTNWEALNPVLALGEPGYNTTENKIKIGDGVTAWVDLDYLTDAAGTAFTLTPATSNALGGVKLGEGFVLNASNQVTTSKLYSTNESDSNVHYRLELDANGVVVLPDQSIINGSTMRGVYGTGELNYTGITIGPDADHREESWVWVDASGAHVGTSFSTDAHTWNFTNDGNLQLPVGGDIIDSNGDSVLGGGGAADLGSFTIESNALSVDSGTDIYIETFETGGPGESRLVLKPQDDNAENPTRLEGSYDVGIWSNTTSAGDNVNKWLFGRDGALDLPNHGVIRNQVDSQDVNIVSTGFAQLQWTTPEGVAEANPNNTNELVNWLYVESDGIHIETNVNGDGDSNQWLFNNTGGLEFPDGTTQTTAYVGGVTLPPSWITVVPNTQHFPILNTDYGFDSTGFWTVNATIGNSGEGTEGTSYPFRTTFSIPNTVKSVTTVDFVVDELGADFGIGIFAVGTNPVWDWDLTEGNPDANRIGAQYNGDEPELHGISGGSGSEYSISTGTYRARLTVDPVAPGEVDITLETLNTNGTVLDTITYTETSFFNTNYQIGFGSDQDSGTPKVYFNNLTINIDDGATIYQDTLTGYNSVGTLQNTLTNGQYSVTLQSDGKLEFPELTTLADTTDGFELTINRPTTEWYSVYGDINTTNWSNATGSGSVVHSTDGNIYVLGSTTNYADINDSHNLFLKYNTNGVLDWSRTWTDQTGMDCGSFNTSMRFLPVTAGKSDQETIYWSSFNPWNAYAYVGTMDTDGNLVSGYGEVRAPVQLANVRLADLEVATGSNVYVVGARLGSNYANTTPFIATVNLDTHTANSAITVSPPYIDITNTQSYTNFFKSVCAVNGNVIAVGTYYQSDIGYHWPILTKHVPGGATRTYHLTYSNTLSNYYGELVAYSDFHDAVYVLINNEEGADFGVVGKVNSNFSGYDWVLRLGDNGIEVFLLGMTFDADGNIYILGELPGINNTDFVLIKMTDSADGVLWQRKIGSSEYDGSGRNTFGSTGWESSTGISVQGDHVVITGVTNKLNAGQPNAVTIKYPTDGSLIGDFGQYSVSTFDVGLVTDWSDTINDLTGGTIVTEIDGNATFRNNVTEASLIASTKTIDADYGQLHWDMTNNYLYVPERKWTFGEDGSITMPNAAKLYEDEPGTLIIKSTGGTSINYNPYPFIANVPNNSIAVSGVTSNQNGVAVYVEKKISDTYLQYSQWQFNDNGGLQFPDGTTQYGAYLAQELALDGGSAISVFPYNMTNPRLADGGGSASRFGAFDPNYDGNDGGATIDPNNFTLTLNGGGA